MCITGHGPTTHPCLWSSCCAGKDILKLNLRLIKFPFDGASYMCKNVTVVGVRSDTQDLPTLGLRRASAWLLLKPDLTPGWALSPPLDATGQLVASYCWNKKQANDWQGAQLGLESGKASIKKSLRLPLFHPNPDLRGKGEGGFCRRIGFNRAKAVVSFYRKVYLKSEHWLELRNKKLSKGNHCRLCLRYYKSLDVHHLKYRKLYQVQTGDLRVVCRACHEKIHKLLETYPKLKKQDTETQWRIIESRLSVGGLCSKRNLPKIKYHHHGRAIQEFGLLRDVYVGLGICNRQRLKWIPALNYDQTIFHAADVSPWKFAEAYQKSTGVNPLRRYQRLRPERLLCFTNFTPAQ